MLVARAPAAPVVDIRAQTQLVLGSVRLVGDEQAEVTGQLLDRLTGDGLGNQRVIVRVGGAEATTFTQPDGTFRVTMYVAPGPQTVELSYGGSTLLDAAQPFTTVTDPARAQVVLSVRAEPAPDGMLLIVNATVEDRPAQLPVEISLGIPGETALKPLQTIQSGSDLIVTRAAAGGPGPRRIRASFAGDDARQAATAETVFELSSTTTTTMKLADTDLAYEDDIVVTGKVIDEDDQPVARAAVTLTAGDRRLAQGATRDDGTYRFEVEAEILGKGQYGVVVASDPALTFLRGSKADPVIIKIAAPQPVPVSYTIAAFLLTTLAAAGFFLARSKPWRRLRRAAPPADAPEKDTGDEPASGGLVVAKPGIVSTLRRPHDDGFSGAVRDTVRARPVPDAVVRIILGSTDREVRTAADGSFAIEGLPPGEWRAEVAAPGHVTERFAVTIPHRGELRGVRVDLVPVRERVFQLYRRAAEPALPEARLWGIWSPRQIVDHVRAKRPSPALAELTDFVEEVYFSARVSTETVIPHASERVDRAIRERGAV